MPSRTDKVLGPKLPPRARYRVVLIRPHGEHYVLSTHRHIDDAVTALHASHSSGYIAAGRRGRVRTSWGESWLVRRLR